MIVDIHAHAVSERFLSDLRRRPIAGISTERGDDGTYFIRGGGWNRPSSLDVKLHDLSRRLESLRRRQVELQLFAPSPGFLSWAGGAASREWVRALHPQEVELAAQSEGLMEPMVVFPLGEPEHVADEGCQRAKAVAKLRMKFGATWFTGTAFLVTPDTLLTAHHNLWSSGKRADAVEVIFDYELSATGPDMESSTHVPDLESFAGNEKEDWAVMKLHKPQAGRPLAPLAIVPAKQGDRVAIIQHPSGMLKQVALHHNLVTYADSSWIQYFTDTLPGSSGSPVFDAQWNVVAIHHKGGNIEIPGKKETVFRNQGIVVQRVIAGVSDLGIKG